MELMPLTYEELLKALLATASLTPEMMKQSITVKIDDEYLPVFKIESTSNSEGVLDDPHLVLSTELED
jgi:hypothetical protein